MIIYILLIILGFVLLKKGADILVDSASKLAKKFNIPEIIIGLTIVSIGTSMPELIVSATAAVQGHSDLAIGNVIGSNLSNLFLILGLCSVIKNLPFKKQTKLLETPFTIFCTVLLFIFANNFSDKVITKIEGFFFLLFVLLFIIYNILMTKKNQINKNEIVALAIYDSKSISTTSAILGFILGSLSLKLGGDLVVANTLKTATLCGFSEKFMSLTIVAFSTSLPELITSITATKKGDTDMAIGNILGSQIFNILLIIGVSSILKPIHYSIKYNSELILLCFGTVMFALFPFIGKKNEMTKVKGIFFLTIYTFYMLHLIV